MFSSHDSTKPVKTIQKSSIGKGKTKNWKFSKWMIDQNSLIRFVRLNQQQTKRYSTWCVRTAELLSKFTLPPKICVLLLQRVGVWGRCSGVVGSSKVAYLLCLDSALACWLKWFNRFLVFRMFWFFLFPL